MKLYLPQISWHDRSAILALSFQNINSAGWYKLSTCSMTKEVRIWEFYFEETSESNPKPPAQLVNFVADLTGHNASVNVVRFSPDGSILASGDSDGLIILWELNPSSAPDIFGNEDLPPNKENWLPKRRLRFHCHDVCDLNWSTDGKKIASVSVDKSLIIVDVESGKKVKLIKDFKQFPNGVIFDPRGKYLLTMSIDREIDVLNCNNWSRIKRINKCQLPAINLMGNDISAANYRLFADDQMLMSFARRGSFCPDGQLLILPSGLLEIERENLSVSYIVSRCDFERPIAILPSNSPTFAAACCPVIFKLHPQAEQNFIHLEYRMVFALLTKDAVLIYDTQHSAPIGLVDNIHYSSLTDLAWSPDGLILLVSSTDGYCTFIRFDPGELGEEYGKLPTPPSSPELVSKTPRRSKISTGKKSETMSNLSKTPKQIKDGLSQALSNTTKETPTLFNFMKKVTKTAVTENVDTHSNSKTPKIGSDSLSLSSLEQNLAKRPKRVQLITLTEPTSAVLGENIDGTEEDAVTTDDQKNVKKSVPVVDLTTDSNE